MQTDLDAVGKMIGGLIYYHMPACDPKESSPRSKKKPLAYVSDR
jgi:hypothetical protein